MPISVDLPAPFSPTIPWMVPGRTASETARLAWTAPNRLSMPRSSITARGSFRRGPQARGVPAACARATGRPGSLRGVVGDLDLAGDDVGARLLEAALHLRGDQRAVVLVDRVAHAAVGDPEDARARLPRPRLRAHEALVHREVHALDHRGEDRAGVDVVLVRVHADRELALVLRGLEHAEAGGARGGVDHVGAAVELAPRQLAAAGGVAPGGGRGPGHVLVDLDRLVDVVRALLVSERELPDQRDVHAADEADLPGLGRHRRRHPDQERALVLLEHDRLHVGQRDHRIDDRELDRGELLRDLLETAGLREADADDDRRASPRHVAQRLLALALVGDLELTVLDAGLLLVPLRAVVGGLVERLVELAAHVE